jgi:integrase
MLAALKAILNWGEREELIADGAARCCKHIRKNPERPRERFLSTEELGRLGRAIDQAEEDRSAHSSAILGLRLLILTGCRRSEILKLTWPEVDFERRCLRLRDSKTGPKVVPLGSAALELLEKAPRHQGNPYVCAGSRQGSRYSNIEKPWRRIREAAGLPDVRIHDLRHSFASVGVGAGIGLPIVGHILGHRQPATTARYAHFANEPVRQATEMLTDAISRALNGK